MVTILIMLAKMATLGILKIKVFVHGVTNKILSLGPNYNVDLAK